MCIALDIHNTFVCYTVPFSLRCVLIYEVVVTLVVGYLK